MRDRMRDAAALTVTIVCLVLGLLSWIGAEPRLTGVTLRTEGATLVVATIDAEVNGYADDLRAGAIVEQVDGFPVAELRPEKLTDALVGDFSELRLRGDESIFRFDILPERPLGLTYLVGIILFAGMGVFTARGHAGPTLRQMAIPLAAASATPLMLVPSWASPNVTLVSAAVVLPTLARILAADWYVDAMRARWARSLAAVVAIAAAVGYLALVFVFYGLSPVGLLMTQVVSPVTIVPASAITIVPAILFLREQGRAGATDARGTAFSERLPIALAALTPVVIPFGYLVLGLGPAALLLWLLLAVLGLQTTARFDTLRVQRDTVVAATEAERARLAADLHDDALQEMTLLVRRLDDVGDSSSASLARSIADRLREVCGELRLPILDELGAGDALEWLVDRVGETSGREVRLERVDAGRPPASVELAVFRVAQEALQNAVLHGAPPITVRYDAAADRAALSITDQGIGLSSDAAANAGRSGHYGLLNMRQRAEQIGARIDFAHPPGGGTVIGFVWAPG